MPKQELDFQIGKDQIIGFSYSFTKALTEFLKEKIDESQITDGSLQPEVTSAIEWLREQLQCPMGQIDNAFELTMLIDHAQKFLAIFETEQPEKTDGTTLQEKVRNVFVNYNAGRIDEVMALESIESLVQK
jgi:hypothetical protein